jgi:aconitate hydratase
MNSDFNVLKNLPNQIGASKQQFYSISSLEEYGFSNIKKLPYTLKIILESMLRNVDNKKITFDHIKSVCDWKPNDKRNTEIPFVVSRVILQDYTGVPLLADLAAMREAMVKLGKDPKLVEPLVPVDLVIDHSVQTNYTNRPDAVKLNMEMEFIRNKERYQFMKWAGSAFSKFNIIPPRMGIVHQINLEYIAKGVFNNQNIIYPDTVVGTDSHTTMINGIGVLGWGVGGIEAEAAMLGQPIYMLMPDVIGVHLYGELKDGITTTDLVLTLTEMLRAEKVVGKIIEYFGDGASSLSVPERATIANMAPDYGATMGYFAIDDKTIDYYRATGRKEQEISIIKEYFSAQDLFGIPKIDEIEYTKVLELDLNKIEPCVSGPKRPQDRVNLPDLKLTFSNLLLSPIKDGGYNLTTLQKDQEVSMNSESNTIIKHGDIVIAGITSCTNTSNPSVLIAAGLVAKKAYEYGLKVKPYIKSSLAPGSRAVTEYLKDANLLEYLEQVGFGVAAYGCTTCIGNIGDLDIDVEKSIQNNDLVVSSVLSGNRNFEARIHPLVKSNFLMSPPLVVAFALAGTVLIDMEHDQIGTSKDGKPIYLKDLWPTSAEIAKYLQFALNPSIYSKVYTHSLNDNILWNKIESSTGDLFKWDSKSTYIACPPFFENFNYNVDAKIDIKNARILAILGDSITTDHISPAGSIEPQSPAGEFLQSNNVHYREFNSYGARRGHHEVMMRGTFSNTRLKNLLLNQEGGLTLYYPDATTMTIYDAAMKYKVNEIPTIIIAGEEYGTGSSRDWAAKGTMLLGVKAVIAKSFERIHRSNLIGMGVLPCQLIDPNSISTLDLDGSETIDLLGFKNLSVHTEISMLIHKQNQETIIIKLIARLDTDIEVDYYSNKGILPYILNSFLD